MKEKQQFKLVFKEKYIPISLLYQRQLRVVSQPKEQYIQWWWRILEFLTFGKRFCSGYSYLCEEDETKENLFSGLGSFAAKKD